MNSIHEETDNTGVTYRLFIEEEDIEVRGNAMSSGNEVLDRECEDEILTRLESGELWAWCCVVVRAERNGFNGQDSLGCCSYLNTESFIQPGGYWDDMKAQAKDSLIENLKGAAFQGSKALATLESIGVAV